LSVVEELYTKIQKTTRGDQKRERKQKLA